MRRPGEVASLDARGTDPVVTDRGGIAVILLLAVPCLIEAIVAGFAGNAMRVWRRSRA